MTVTRRNRPVDAALHGVGDGGPSDPRVDAAAGTGPARKQEKSHDAASTPQASLIVAAGGSRDVSTCCTGHGVGRGKPSLSARLSKCVSSISPIPAGKIFALLVIFRISNALLLRTFFQPDEYFQALEPAWELAFGQGGGAWITWVSLFINCLFFVMSILFCDFAISRKEIAISCTAFTLFVETDLAKLFC